MKSNGQMQGNLRFVITRSLNVSLVLTKRGFPVKGGKAPVTLPAGPDPAANRGESGL